MNSHIHILQKDYTILHIEPLKKMTKVVRVEPERFARQALKQKSRTYCQSSLDYLSNDPNYLQPKQFVSHLKQLKSLKSLKIDLGSLLHIPKHFFHKILDSFKYLKGLSVIHFELKSVSYVLQHLNFQHLCKNLLIIDDLFKVQVKFSLEAFGMNMNEALGLTFLLETLIKLERFTFINLKFISSADITQILEVIETLRASRSLIKFSLSLEKCQLDPANRLHELFLTLKEIKLLKYSEREIKRRRNN